jgi:hypothetical protein
MSSARYIESTRKTHLTVLGALMALLLIHGITPERVGPVILQYIVHGCNLESIHPSFLGEWHPELRRTILDWLEIGSAGDVTPFQGHFATYFNMQVCPVPAQPYTASCLQAA